MNRFLSIPVTKIGISTLVLLALDGVYLTVMKPHFVKQIQSVQHSPLSIRVYPVVLCYLLLILGLYFFVLRENRSWKYAALLGCIVYGVYDTTTLALLKEWSWKLALVDTIWGTVLFSLTTVITYFILSQIE
jgi:uncharacterized membrane protein